MTESIKPHDIEIIVKYHDGKTVTGKLQWSSICSLKEFHNTNLIEEAYQMLLKESEETIF